MDCLEIPTDLHHVRDDGRHAPHRSRAEADALLNQVNGALAACGVRLAATWHDMETPRVADVETHLLESASRRPHVLDLFFLGAAARLLASRRAAAMTVPDWADVAAVTREIAAMLETSASLSQACARIQMRAAARRLFGGGGTPPLPAVSEPATRPPAPALPLAPPLVTPQQAFPKLVKMARDANSPVARPAAKAPPAAPPARASLAAPRVGRITIRVEAHLLDSGGRYASNRPRESAMRLLEQAAEVWAEQADIHWQIAGLDTLRVEASDLDRLLDPKNPRGALRWPEVAARTLHVYFVRAFPEGAPGSGRAFAIAHSAMSGVFVSDYSQTVYAFLALARHVGTALGLRMRPAGTGLMVLNSNDRNLHPSEVETARGRAARWSIG